MDGAGLAAERVRVRVRGLVQGVGFRPFVHRLAGEFGLRGSVRNDAEGVLIEAEGASLAAFVEALSRRAPPLARVDAVEREVLPPGPPLGAFRVAESARGGAAPATAAIGPDAAVCDDCLRELFDPRDRRHLYPFLNCTNCGPRFTIAASLPYDRPRTAMAGFPMCADCAREYADPADRRFHAQPVACPACGPRLSMAMPEIVAWLRAGQILAVKGIGGFHLCCDARNAGAVARLRESKRRESKPLALMAANTASLRAIAEVSAEERSALESPARPIVLLRRRDTALPDPAPGLAWIGAMLPYAPLHWLLFHEAAARPAGHAWREEAQDLLLVMTSANPPGEPLVLDGAEAAERLGGLADAVVDHDRPILVRADDPVARVSLGEARWLRRGRGCTPAPVRLARPGPPVAALGAHSKSAACVTRGRDAFLSQHVGDLDSARARDFLGEVYGHLRAVLEVAPAIVAHDLHPDLASTALARRLGPPTLAVQHHHAHVAAVLAEHGVEEPTLGLALDGHGYGSDGGAWGGEALWVEGARFARAGHLAPLALPGGDAAARQPWRMAASALHATGRGEEVARRFAREAQSEGVAAMLARGVRCPPTTSCGRWFDAAAGLLGVCATTRYEGEAAMRLESLVRRPRALLGAWRVEGGVLDLLPLLAALERRDAQDGAEIFHGTLAAALVDWAMPLLRGTDRVALGGGCLANAVLAEELANNFARRGVRALLPRLAPPGDGGLALGQAWVAQRHLEEGGAPCA